MNKILIAFAVSIGLFSCQIEDLEENNASGATADQEQVQVITASSITADNIMEANMLIADSTEKEWKTLGFTLDNTTMDCRLDDEMIFNANGTYLFSRGAKSCGGEDNRSSRTGSWEVDFDNKELIFDRGTSMEETSEIIALNNNELRLKGIYFNLEVRGRFQVK